MVVKTDVRDWAGRRICNGAHVWILKQERCTTKPKKVSKPHCYLALLAGGGFPNHGIADFWSIPVPLLCSCLQCSCITFLFVYLNESVDSSSFAQDNSFRRTRHAIKDRMYPAIPTEASNLHQISSKTFLSAVSVPFHFGLFSIWFHEIRLNLCFR